MTAAETAISTNPDDWMNNAEACAEFNRIVQISEGKLRPLMETMEASERLSEADFAIRINAKE